MLNSSGNLRSTWIKLAENRIAFMIVTDSGNITGLFRIRPPNPVEHFQTVVLEKTLESPLDCKEIKPVNRMPAMQKTLV